MFLRRVPCCELGSVVWNVVAKGYTRACANGSCHGVDVIVLLSVPVPVPTWGWVIGAQIGKDGTSTVEMLLQTAQVDNMLSDPPSPVMLLPTPVRTDPKPFVHVRALIMSIAGGRRVLVSLTCVCVPVPGFSFLPRLAPRRITCSTWTTRQC